MRFKDEYAFLSNMYPVTITYNGYTFGSTEAAYQAQKEPARAAEFTVLDGYKAKKLGKKVNVRPDWDSVKLDIMRDLVNIKFKKGTPLYDMLKAVKEPIVEDNYWHDTYWGVCEGVGENHLGKLLEEIKNRE